MPERFILFISTLEPRKNVPTLLEAYARIAASTDAPLIIGGGKGWLYDDIFAKAEALDLGDRVRAASGDRGMKRSATAVMGVTFNDILVWEDR